MLGGALVIALVIRTFLFTTFWIPSASMEPTLIGRADRHDRIIVNRLSYKLHDVHRGDIIVFEKPPGESATTEDGRPIKDLIKRVIGLPGETVTLRGGQVFVDGAAARRALPARRHRDRTRSAAPGTEFKVPEGPRARDGRQPHQLDRRPLLRPHRRGHDRRPRLLPLLAPHELDWL